MRRHVLVLAAVGTAGLALLLSSAAAARPGVKLTVTPPLVTSGTTATFRWTARPGTLRTRCRLRWKALPGTGDKASSISRARAKLRRCRSPKTWGKLVPGRYTFVLIAYGRRHKSTRTRFSWKVVPLSAPGSPPPPPPPPPPGTSCATSPYSYLKPVHPEISGDEQQFVNLVNQARGSLGLQPLTVNSQLSLAADSHSYWQDSALNLGLSHAGCNGSDPFERMSDAGYTGVYEGEVTLVRKPPASAQTAFDMFKGSPGHWALLTSSSFTQIGVGKSGYHWTGDLG